MPLPSDWSSPQWSNLILGRKSDKEWPDKAQLQEWLDISMRRLRQARDILRRAFVGMGPNDEGARHIAGYLTDWLLAGLIARENVLLIGPPGTAKTQIALLAYRLLGLSEACVDDQHAQLLEMPVEDIRQWHARSDAEQKVQKYFHYLLSRYTQPDEIFGPLSLEYMKKGILVRINFSFATGPGVRGLFFDEVFKASSSILNTLLTLLQERTYFNWGANVPADAVMLIGATNEMPGQFGGAVPGVAERGEDFSFLYAFLDRFSVRLRVPTLSFGSDDGDVNNSSMVNAVNKAWQREQSRFINDDDFHETLLDLPVRPEERACVNDLLFAGRAMFWDDIDAFDVGEVKSFNERFINIALELMKNNTDPSMHQITWTISPRKLRSLKKVALAHALLCDDSFTAGRLIKSPDSNELGIFNLIWDSPEAEGDLLRKINPFI
ncbi:AAA family ATPase [Candidatus Sumerlaeota bacterium]|nr:AAA family ATPase [Candidatus Sumerlaeota bacterium]